MQNESAQIDLQNREVKLQRTALAAEVGKLQEDRLKLDSEKTRLKDEQHALSLEVKKSEARLSELRDQLLALSQRAQLAEARSRVAYPALRSQLIDQFFATAKDACASTKVTPLHSDIGHNEYTERFPANVVFSLSTLECMQLQFRRGTYSKQLLPGDTERLLYGIGQLGHNLENVRAEAIKVYSESRYLSPLTYLNSTGMEYDFGQPQPGACPVACTREC